ncbi:hypothetical protein EDB84DRAFT_1676444 [Lactarius hengduanensis]|nr:hypothetical protein EDB84DRAFT_1676444 [Lactarius hengduanensis]
MAAVAVRGTTRLRKKKRVGRRPNLRRGKCVPQDTLTIAQQKKASTSTANCFTEPSVLSSPRRRLCLAARKPVAAASNPGNPSPPPPAHHRHLPPIAAASNQSPRPLTHHTAQMPPRRYPHTAWNFRRYDTDDDRHGGGRRRPTRRGTTTTRRELRRRGRQW